MENQKKQQQGEDSLDMVFLAKYLLAYRKFIIKFVVVITVLAVVICLLKPKKFKCEVSILPLSQSSISSSLGSLSSMASLAGINLGSMSNDENIITAELYPAVAESTPFLLKMTDIPLKWEDPDTIMSYYEHAVYDSASVGAAIFKYTIGLPFTIKQMFTPPPTMDFGGEEPQFITLSEERRAALMDMQEMILVDQDATTGLILLSVTAETPQQSAQLATEALDILQSTIVNYKTKRARKTLDFIEERYQETLAEYEKVREAFFTYKDTHRDMLEERVDVEYQRLSDEYQISYSVLNTLSSQMEQAKLTLMENTPVFSIVEPVVMPEKKDSPSLKTHLFVGVFLGLLFSIGWLVVKLYYYQMFAPAKYVELNEKYNPADEPDKEAEA